MAVQLIMMGAVTLLIAWTARAQPRACMLDDQGDCSAVPCPGGAFAAWDACFAIVNTTADCAPECDFASFAGLDQVPGFCAAPGFGGSIPLDVAQAISAGDCLPPANAETPECLAAFGTIFAATGCDAECEAEIGGIAETCGTATAQTAAACTAAGEAPSCDAALAPLPAAAAPVAAATAPVAADAPAVDETTRAGDTAETDAAATGGDTATEETPGVETTTGSGTATTTVAALSLLAALPLALIL